MIDVFSLIKAKETALFVGAGISFNSGLPLADQMTKKILNELGITNKDAELILNSVLPFEAFMQVLAKETDISEILEVFNQGEPNTNHFFIAQLVKEGLVTNILTTNFDLNIEKALNNLGFNKKIHYDVFSSESEFQQIDWEDNKPKLIKIHGCISKPNEVAITMANVASQTNCVYKNKVVRDFFSEQVNECILVAGYSCSDVFDLSPQIESQNSVKSKIVLIEHIFSQNLVSQSDINLKKGKSPFATYPGVVIAINTDVFVEQVWKDVLTQEYLFISSRLFLWPGNIQRWLLKCNWPGLKL